MAIENEARGTEISWISHYMRAGNLTYIEENHFYFYQDVKLLFLQYFFFNHSSLVIMVVFFKKRSSIKEKVIRQR